MEWARKVFPGLEDNEAIEMAIKALEQEPCDTCRYEEGSIYCKEHCPHEAKVEYGLSVKI